MDTAYSYVVYRPNPYVFPTLTFARIQDGDMVGAFYPVALGQHCYGFSRKGDLLTVYNAAEVEYTNGTKSYEWMTVDISDNDLIDLQTDIKNNELSSIFSTQNRIITSSVPTRKITTLNNNISYSPMGHGKSRKTTTNSFPRATRSSTPIETSVYEMAPTDASMQPSQRQFLSPLSE